MNNSMYRGLHIPIYIRACIGPAGAEHTYQERMRLQLSLSLSLALPSLSHPAVIQVNAELVSLSSELVIYDVDILSAAPAMSTTLPCS